MHSLHARRSPALANYRAVLRNPRAYLCFGVVIVEGIWPNAAFEEGIGINLLTSADPGPPQGGAVYHDTSVWLRPA